jgi:hypothetical protein
MKRPLTGRESLKGIAISIIVITVVLLLNQKCKNGMDRNSKINNSSSYNIPNY